MSCQININNILDIRAGMSQGSVLRLVLYLLSTNDVLRTSNSTIFKFVGDTVLIGDRRLVKKLQRVV